MAAQGVQVTRQRVRIAAVLLDRRQHVTAEQLLDMLRARGVRVSKATVYNTLNLFARRGLIRELTIDGQRTWFDSNIEPHFHFQHGDDGTLVDIPLQEVRFAKLPEPPPGTEVAGIELVIRLRRRGAKPHSVE
ncbi:MAG: transcriptional repressor [Steroidobacteraceae bacterium]|nr:transcriptional repressor [Steroidobacteraceae bacterium]MDW8259495.1 Fur family transcriptional regulator [Gammaproteobacteria bacterium]